MEHLSKVAGSRRPSAGHLTFTHAANDNKGRCILVRIAPPPTITVAEIEVFGALLADFDTPPVNDNFRSGDAT